MAQMLLLLLLLAGASALRLEFGPDCAAPLQARVEQLLSPFADVTNLTLSLGQTSRVRQLIPQQEVAAIKLDGFIVRAVHQSGDSMIVAVAANQSLGVSYGAFDVLRTLGFGWLHPMKVIHPERLQLPRLERYSSARLAPQLPRYELRGSHVHAEHPTELCSVLNGFDQSGSWQNRSSWQQLVPEWQLYLEWLVANRQNHVEWSLLSAHAYEEFEILVDLAKDWGLAVGIDATFSQTQEHGWRLWRSQTHDEAHNWGQIVARLDWLLTAGFTSISSELGTSELTEGNNVTMLMALLNRTADHLEQRGVKFMVENHITGGQTIPLPDPLHPSQPINFNWMTYYLSPWIISRPHTVQVYNLLDRAPTYGGQNFSSTVDFVDLMLNSGRSVAWYPETNYWCNYDAPVPLFLAPLYSLARVSDLQTLDAIRAPKPLQGQATSASTLHNDTGFSAAESENVVAASVQWETDDAFGLPPLELLSSVLSKVLQPVAGVDSDSIVRTLVQIASAQHALLVEGKVDGKETQNITLRSGMAYIQGFDAMADLWQVISAAGIANLTSQPDRIPLPQLISKQPAATKLYQQDVAPLLSEMAQTFLRLSSQLNQSMTAAISVASSVQLDLLTELSSSMQVLALRANQVYFVYQAAESCVQKEAARSAFCLQQLAGSASSIEQAQLLVTSREQSYGLFAVGSDRLWQWGWDSNPTAYGFGHLWAAHKLYYWRRDHHIVQDSLMSPCVDNIRSPLDIYLGDGTRVLVQRLEEWFTRAFGGLSWIGCLTPLEEPFAV